MRDIWKYHRFFTLVAAVIAWALLTGTPGFAGDFPGDGVDGPPLKYKLEDGQIIEDKNTDLQWELKVPGGSGQSCLDNLHGVDATCTWYEATGAWIEALNAENYAGHSDWRLPNVRELMSIVDYSEFEPAIDPIFDPTATAFYWSSTYFAGEPSPAWGVNFTQGFVFLAFDGGLFRVRAVRGGR